MITAIYFIKEKIFRGFGLKKYRYKRGFIPGAIQKSDYAKKASCV
jgi:hypothetical protein